MPYHETTKMNLTNDGNSNSFPTQLTRKFRVDTHITRHFIKQNSIKMSPKVVDRY